MPSVDPSVDPSIDAAVTAIQERQAQANVPIACAESCTGGLIAARLVGIDGSGDWFRGGVVAYQADVKFSCLGVRPGPVINPDAAVEMAIGVARLLGGRISLATTGVAGPDEEEGVPVGRVFVAISVDGRADVHRLDLAGDPLAVRYGATRAAVLLLRDAVCVGVDRRHDAVIRS
jgi:PncC family amidohydrolase